MSQPLDGVEIVLPPASDAGNTTLTPDADQALGNDPNPTLVVAVEDETPTGNGEGEEEPPVVVDQPPPPPRNNRRWMGCAGLIALALLLALLGLVCAGAIGGLTAWWSTRTPPAPVATVVMDGGVLNGAVMCADAWNEGSVINTGTLVHTTIPSGIDGVYQVVELRGATQDGIGRCTANGAVVQASDVLAAVRKHPAGNDIPMGGYTLIGFGTQRF